MVELPCCFETKKKSGSSRFNAYNQRLNADRQILIAAFRAVNKATYNFIRKRDKYRGIIQAGAFHSVLLCAFQATD